MGLFNKDVKNENKVSDISATTEESRVIKRLYLVDFELLDLLLQKSKKLNLELHLRVLS